MNNLSTGTPTEIVGNYPTHSPRGIFTHNQDEPPLTANCSFYDHSLQSRAIQGAWQPSNMLSTAARTENVRKSNASPDNTFLNQQFQYRSRAFLRIYSLQHLPIAPASLGSSRFHTVSAALGFDHLETLGARFGWVQRLGCA
ncbi:Phosphoribosylformylglycinamidine synthase [Pseudomonas syringae pv. actinidiae]|uniref:Phosphoribosylformylglycinamidine synthase n=1 Tax=Pseudomonas syringae pv. actinidiae TaxID=103796 RepID=A0A2V0Q9M0_PSESF|nr:Phosphoribosylformylglycinamidine synthase [Pseudomonas syringae pv. actinidiae]